MPTPPAYWDLGNDGDPDATAATIDADGSGWTTTKLDRLNGAVDEWYSETQWKPSRVVSGYSKVFLDGTLDPDCAYPAQYWAVTCVHFTRRGSGSAAYDDISRAHVTFATAADMSWYGFEWWYGSTHDVPSNGIDFQGVATHELGHYGALLNDLDPPDCNYGTGMYTMCGFTGSIYGDRDDSWRYRTLTSTDIAAMNLVY